MRSLHDLGLIKGARATPRGVFRNQPGRLISQVDLGARERVFHCHGLLRALSPSSDNIYVL